MLTVISDNRNPSVLVTLPTIFPAPADAFRCPSVSINLFVKCKSTGFWLVGEDAHDDQEQNMTTAIRVPIKNRYFFTGIINSPFKVYEDLNNLQIVKVELESPLLGREFRGVGKSVIHEIFSPLERSLRPKGRSFEKIQCGRGLKPLPNFLTGFTEISRPREPTPNPSQEGNNPCHPLTRMNKMKIPIQ